MNRSPNTPVQTSLSTTKSQPVKNRSHRIAALSLIEVLCVIAIIAILASLYLGVVNHTFTKVKRFFQQSTNSLPSS